MTEELVEIEVDGRLVQARKGAMLIEVTDAAGIDVPRFCYHKHLSIAANCRMCLVDVENAPKPLPACATPVVAGMKVHTTSERALDAQRGTMEFLLINHPLDCPICDQGGECELQDLSLGYGEGISRFTEGKRVVVDEDLGPLISTDMTRCIHCTRCVRFGTEIAGVRELGATGRGEDMRIGTYVGRTVNSEMSGNVIDLCPVGALTNKPARYTLRPWELVQKATVSPYDCIGSNLFLHTRQGRVMRCVPRENPGINETWISDRDRYAHFGLYARDRVMRPLIKTESGIWEEVEWDVALEVAARALGDTIRGTEGGDGLATLISGYATVEEQFLAQKLTRALGSPHVDHRLRQLDFSDQRDAPVMPWLGQSIRQLESVDAALLIGSHVRKEQPLAAHRLRKAVVRRGARISFLNPRRHAYHFDVDRYLAVHPDAMVDELAAIVAAAAARANVMPPGRVSAVVGAVTPRADHVSVAAALMDGATSTVLLGSQAMMHPRLADLRLLADTLAGLTNARFGYLAEAGNSCGAWLTGCVPHRGAGGTVLDRPGRDASELLAQARSGYLLVGVEPEYDAADPAAATAALHVAGQVVVIGSFTTDAMLQYANVILPAAGFAETAGTLVSAEGLWQPFDAAVNATGDSRPAWKILRVLADRLGTEGFDAYRDIDDVRTDAKATCAGLELDNSVRSGTVGPRTDAETAGLLRFGDVPPYSVEPLVRRSRPLQDAADGARAVVRLSPGEARSREIRDGDRVRVRQGNRTQVFRVAVDADIVDGCVWIPQALPETTILGPACGPVELEKA